MPNIPSLDWSLLSAWFSAVLAVVWPLIAIFAGVAVGAFVFSRVVGALRGPAGGAVDDDDDDDDD
jgi:hypothetical protein